MTVKYAVGCLLILLVGTNALWLYRHIDQGATLMYSQQVLDESLKKNEILSTLLAFYLKEVSVGELKPVLEQELPDDYSFHFTKEGKLHVPFVSFSLDEDGMVVYIE